MAYIGQQPFQEFTSIPTKDSFTGDGSTTTFDLANDVVRGAENALEVFIDNVRQEPGSGKAFTLGVDGSNNFRRITFTAAPANGASIYVINDKTNLTAIAPVNTDFNGAELVLDADADTTLHADTDDEIDVRVGGNDIITIKHSSGDGILQIPVDAKDLQFLQADGFKVAEINDGGFLGVGGNSNAAGEIRIFEDTDNGSNYVGFSAPNVTTSRTYIFPAADGSSGTHLTTDGSGNLSWSASLSLANDSNNRVVTGTGSGLNGEANLTFDGSTLALTGAMTASGIIKTDDTTAATNTTDGSLQTDGGLSVAADAVIGDDLILLSDAAVLNFGANSEIKLTHVHDTGLLLTDSGGTPTLQFHDANESISSDGTDLTLAAGADINLTATTDINIPSNVGLTFGNDGEKIEGDGTDLTISGNNINLTATADVVVPANVGITFGTGEKIEGDNTDLTITSGAKINLTATSDVHIPNNVGIVFGGDSEKIEGDGTDMTISANNLTIDAAADITLDAAGNDLNFAAGGTTVLTVSNSSSDVVIKPVVDAKDIIFQQRDGTEVMRIEDGAHASFAAAAVNPEATLTDASTISWNVLTSPVAKVTLGANRTLGAGSGAITGQFVSLLVIQDGTGSRTLSFNAVYEFKDDTAPTLTTTAAKGDLFVFRYNGSKFLEVGRNQNLTLS